MVIINKIKFMKIQNTSLFLLFLIFTISCEQLGDSLRLPGEDPKDIIYYELNNDYLAPESREFIEQNFPSQSVNTSYILIGKNTYGFEADLTNDKSLSFDEDGAYKFDRDHPFIKDIYEKGKFGRGKGEGKGDKEDREGGEKDDEDKEKGEGSDKGRGDERCFEFVMPYTVMMPDSSVITLTEDKDREKIKTWYENNPKVEKRPQIQLPVDIIFESEEKEENVTISTREELKEIVESCREFDKENENCFKINLPYSVEMPDSSIITINNVDDRKKIEDWYENNPKNESRHKLIYPVQLVFESEKEDEEPKIVTVNNSDEMKEILSECKEGDKKGRGKDKKEWCKKLDVSEIDDCIKEYVNNNYPDDKIVHSRSILTKEDVTIHVVKLQKAGILKFGEDCEFID